MARGNPQPWFRASRNTFYVTIDGVQHNLHTADKQKAHRLWHEMMANREEPTDSPTVPVINVLAAFAEWAEKHLKLASYTWYRRFLQSFIDSIPSSLRVVDLRPFHVTLWLDRQPQWGASSRRGAIASLKRAFKWAVDEGRLKHSPIASIKKPKVQRRETLLSAEQRDLILAEASDREFHDLLMLVQETGVRPQEVRIVEARHLDRNNGLWIFPADEHKTGERTGEPRIVYLTPTAFEISHRLAEQHIVGPICRNSKGNPWTANAIRCRLRRLRLRLDEKLPQDLCLYLFRHAFATDALERGVDPITVAELMGHKDATMVSQVYQHVGKRMTHMKSAVRRARGENVSLPEGSDSRSEPSSGN